MNLDTRMKRYEFDIRLTINVPVILRIDGKAFHTYTKRCNKPFDADISIAFHWAMRQTSEEMQGFKIAYHQSDEVSFLLTDFDTHETQAWFDYRLQKLVSVAASIFTAHFNEQYEHYYGMPARFDCRAFNIPSDDVANYFLWRAKDCHKNAVSLVAQSQFSEGKLHNKSTDERLKMLLDVGVGFYDYPAAFRNGTFWDGKHTQTNIEPTFEAVSEVVYKPL